MDLNKFTQKSQEAVGEAQAVAIRLGHQQVDVDHLFRALVGQEQGLVPRLLERAGYDVRALASALDGELGKMPRVSAVDTRRVRGSSTGRFHDRVNSSKAFTRRRLHNPSAIGHRLDIAARESCNTSLAGTQTVNQRGEDIALTESNGGAGDVSCCAISSATVPVNGGRPERAWKPIAPRA